jgi:hypothetical protein
MSRKSIALMLLASFAFLTASIAAPSADTVMKETLAKAQSQNKNVLLHVAAPR